MGPVEKLLRAAGELITPDEQRCTGTYARDAAGQEVTPSSPRACSWCAVGALVRADAGKPINATYDIASKLLCGAALQLTGTSSVVGVNDSTELTLDLYSIAIEAAAELGL